MPDQERGANPVSAQLWRALPQAQVAFTLVPNRRGDVVILEPFESAHVKLARARRHIDALAEMAADYLSQKPIVMVLATSPDERQQHMAVIWRLKIPGETYAVLGDAVHNLRAALDVMINDVVSLTGGQPTSATAFPFAGSAESLGKGIRSKMAGASEAARDKVRRLRPYVGGNLPLRALHDLDIRDKHSTALDVVGNVSSPSQTVRPGPHGALFLDWRELRIAPLAKYEPLLAPYSLPEGAILRGVMEDAHFELAFSEAMPLPKEPVLASLEHLWSLVDGIVGDFENEFHPSPS